MRILLTTDHEYPAFGGEGTGRHPREFPSGSAYHVHDLLAKGLAEEGHDVYYRPGKGAAAAMPPGVTLVSGGDFPPFDICHAPAGPPGVAEEARAIASRHGAACLLTCHMVRAGVAAQPNWVFVSQSLAAAHGSGRVVLNGLDPADYVYSDTKEDYLLFMGAMNKASEKGLDLALALSGSLGFRLIAAGTGFDYPAIERTARLCDAAGAEYVGDVRGARKARLLAGARAVLFPSRLSEGCPLVILEAMFSGTPVISSDRGGSVELVTPETGVLCRDDSEWPAAIAGIGAVSPLKCRDAAVDRFHYRRMARDYVREYEAEISR